MKQFIFVSTTNEYAIALQKPLQITMINLCMHLWKEKENMIDSWLIVKPNAVNSDVMNKNEKILTIE